MIYVQSDNVRLAVYEYQPNAKKTVLLVHGWPFSHEIFEYQIRPLTELGFRVVAPDLRGFGASDSPAFGYGYDQMAGDLYNIVASLNLSSFALAGFSMGGAVALRYMRLYGGYGVKKLILFAAAAPCFVRRPDFPPECPESGRRTDRPGEMRSARPHPRILSTAALRPPPWTAATDWLEHIALSSSGIGTVRAACSCGTKTEERIRNP